MIAKIIIWILISYGLTTILVYGSIFNGVRNKIKEVGESNDVLAPIFIFIHGILSCMLCCGAWSGFFLGIFFYSPVAEIFDINPIVSIFFDGLLSAGAVWAFNAIIEWFEKNVPNS